jgi:hypothetical protein
MICSGFFLGLRGLLFVGLFGLAIGAVAQTKPSESPAKDKEKPKEDAEKSAEEEFQPPPVVTDHTVTLSNGRVLSYKAITGYLLIRETRESRYGIYVNGIVLISSALNFQSIDMSPGNDAPFPFFLPSYTAAAWHHKRLSPDLQQLPLKEVLSQSEGFASGDYLLALSRGDTISPADQDRLASQLARFTGLNEPASLSKGLDLLWVL